MIVLRRCCTTTNSSYVSRRMKGSSQRCSDRGTQLTPSSSLSHSFSSIASTRNDNQHRSLYMWGTDTKGSLSGWTTTTTMTTTSSSNSGSISAGAGGDLQSSSSSSAAATTATAAPTAAPTTAPTTATNTATNTLLDLPKKIIDWKSKIPPDDPNNPLNYDISIHQVVAGPTDTAIILTDGRCYVCGENKHGQLGVGHTKPVLTPTLLPIDRPISSISLGVSFSACITADADGSRDLYTFGLGGSTFSGLGYLGHGNVESYHTPKLVESLVEDGCQVQQVQVGECHMTVLTTEGEVLTCGAGSYGRLGNFDTRDQLYLEPVELLSKIPVDQIAGGKSFSLALDATNGHIHGWGRNHKGQLGTGYGLSVDMYAMANIPTLIESPELLTQRVVQIAAGHSHAACITQDGKLYYWGMSLHLEPFHVTGLHGRIVRVACGQDYTLALNEHGTLYAFGKGNKGVLGLGNSIKVLHQPEVVQGSNLHKKKVTAVSAGWSHVACLVHDDDDNEILGEVKR